MLQNKVIHELKILPEYWRKVQSGEKKAEFRKNDRDFQAGDIIRFRPIDDKMKNDRDMFVVGIDMSSEACKEYDYIITHVLLASDVAPIPKGYAILSIQKHTEWKAEQIDISNVKRTLIRINRNFIFTEVSQITFGFVMRFYDRDIDVNDYHQYDIHIKRSEPMFSRYENTTDKPNRLKPGMLLDVEDNMELTVEHVRKPEMNEGIEEPVEDIPKKRK